MSKQLTQKNIISSRDERNQLAKIFNLKVKRIKLF